MAEDTEFHVVGDRRGTRRLRRNLVWFVGGAAGSCRRAGSRLGGTCLHRRCTRAEVVDPIASILIGVGLFGDNLRTAGAWGRSRLSHSW
jgi:hypothetical protein